MILRIRSPSKVNVKMYSIGNGNPCLDFPFAVVCGLR
jgi:hypothetical protein